MASRAFLGQRNGGQRNGSVEAAWFGLEGELPREPQRDRDLFHWRRAVLILGRRGALGAEESDQELAAFLAENAGFDLGSMVQVGAFENAEPGVAREAVAANEILRS